MDCEDIDDKKAKEAIERTKETGNEHGFIQCSDGETGEMLSGGKKSMNIKGSCSSGSMSVYHTHPNNNPRLSDADREVLHRKDVDMVCVGVEHEGEAKMHCERSQPACVTKLEQPETESVELDMDDAIVFMFPNSDGCRCGAHAMQFEELREDEPVYGVTSHPPESIKEFSDKLRLSYPIVSDSKGIIPEAFGKTLRQGHTPRYVAVRRGGETVAEFEGPYDYNVAERALSAYRGELEQPEDCPFSSVLEQPDTLERLPKGSSCIKDKRVPSPSPYFDADEVDRCAKYDTEGKKRKGKKKKKGKDKKKGKKTKRDTPPKEVAGWEREVKKDGKVTYEAVTTAGAPATVPRSETVNAVLTILSHGGKFDHYWTVRADYSWGEDNKKQTVIRTVKTTQDGNKNFNKALERAVEWMKEHPADGGSKDKKSDGKNCGRDRYDKEKIEGKFSEIGPWELQDAGIDTANWIYGGPESNAVVSVERELADGYRNCFRSAVSGWKKGTKLSLTREGYRPRSQIDTEDVSRLNHQKAVSSAINWMMDNQTPPEGDAEGVGDWKVVGEDPPKWEATFKNDFTGSKTGTVELITEEMEKGSVPGHKKTVTAYGYKYEIPGIKGGRSLSDTSRNAALESAADWMDRNQPDDYAIKLPKKVAGWERKKKSKEKVRWEKFGTPEFDNPTDTTKSVTIQRRKKNQWRINGVLADYLPKKGGFSTTRKGRKNTFGDPVKPVEIALEYMEDHPEKIREYKDVPRLTAKVQNKVAKPIANAIKRIADDDPDKPTLGVEFNEESVSLKGTDSANVQMIDAAIEYTAFESLKPHPPEGKFALDGYAFAEAIRNGKMGDTTSIKIEDGGKKNVPPKVSVTSGGSTKTLYAFTDRYESVVPTLPDDIEENLEVSLTTSADWFKTVVKGSNKIATTGPAIWFVTDGEDAYAYVDGDRDTFKGDLKPSEVSPIGDADFPVASAYSYDYLRDMSLSPPRPKSTDVQIRYGSEFPMFFDYDVNPGGEVTIMVAPRISDADSDGFNPDDVLKMETSKLEPCPFSATRLEQSEDDVLAHFEHPSVVTITGQRRAGKSSLAYRLGERFQKEQGIQPVTVGAPEATRKALPKDWIHVDSIHEAPTDSVVIYDEAYRNLNAREPMSDENLNLAEVVQTSAQRGQTLLFVTQNSAILDKVAVGESDAILMKKPGKIQMEFERPQLRRLSEKARERFEKMPADMQEEAYVYVFAEDSEAFVSNSEASFYNDKISHSFRTPCEMNQPESDCPFSQ